MIIHVSSPLSSSEDLTSAAKSIVNQLPGVAISNSEKRIVDVGSFKDIRDGKEYKTVKIGNLVWMAENLNYKMENSWCYGNDDFNCKKYGRLYDWSTAKKACPAGWHLPSRDELEDLIQTVDDKNAEKKTILGDASKSIGGATGFILNALDKIVGGLFEGVRSGGNIAAGKKLKSKDFKGTDDFGFSALMSGGYNSSEFYYIGKGGAWWTSTEFSKTEAYDVFILSDDEYVSEGNNKSHGYSVRCVKD
jgi:uncharacterized protein (TIGR02145 family)